MKVKEDKEETKKDLINLMNASPIKHEDKVEEVKREETKTTERLHGNVVTTESRMETLEAKPGVLSKFTGEQKKADNQRPTPEDKKERKKIQLQFPRYSTTKKKRRNKKNY